MQHHPEADIDFSFGTIEDERQSDPHLRNFRYFRFPHGEVLFYGAQFGKGDVDFRSAEFGDGHVDFRAAEFGDGDVNFSGAEFGTGNVDFRRAEFGESAVNFSGAEFGNGNVFFSGAEFGMGNVDFRCATFGKGDVCFGDTRFRGAAIFFSLAGTQKIHSLSFRNARFDGPFVLGGEFKRPVDLRNTKLDFHADLSELRCDLPRKTEGRWPFRHLVAEDSQDQARLRRLKELAEDARHHAAALRFHADEQRAKRWIERKGLGALLDCAFDLVSDYGQSVWRPTAWWLGIWFLGAVVYAAVSRSFFATLGATWANQHWLDAVAFGFDRLWAGLVLAAGNALALAPGARLARNEAIQTLYGTDPGLFIGAFGLFQGVVSVLFLFLIGLGLRNRFRL